MPPSKKKRGKLRKAAAAAVRAQGKDVDPSHASNDLTHSLFGDSRPGSPSAILDAIKRGESKSTRFLASGKPDVKTRGKLVDGGLIEIVLGFLLQCEDVEIGDATVGDGKTKLKESCATPVDDPSVWISILLWLTFRGALPTPQITDICRLQLAKAIGPIVRCICDPSELFFKSKAHWYSSICQFMSLAYNMTSEHDEIFKICQYKGLVEFCVQSLFWESHRPDIVEGAKDCSITLSAYEPALTMIERTIYTYDGLPEGKSRIQAIGATPIRKKHDLLFILGLINHLQADYREYDSKSSLRLRTKSFRVLHELVHAGCVDKDVIIGLVCLANSKLDSNDARRISTIIAQALIPSVDGRNIVHDNRFAFAIDQGLFDLCLKLTLRFQNSSHDKLLAMLKQLVSAASSVSMSLKSFKAVGRQCSSVMKALQETEDCIDKGQDIFDTIKKIFLVRVGIENYITNVKMCHCCGVKFDCLGRNKCGGCLQVTYCSKKCQQESWENEHKDCCKSLGKVNANVSFAQTKGRKREAALRRNVRAAVDKLVAENWMNIIAQATLLGYDIIDCVVLVELTHSFSVTVMLTADFMHEGSPARDKLDDAPLQGLLPSVCTSICCDETEYGSDTLYHGSTHKIEGFVSWKAAQISYQNGDLTDEMKKNEKAKVMRELFFERSVP